MSSVCLFTTGKNAGQRSYVVGNLVASQPKFILINLAAITLMSQGRNNG